MNIQDKTEAIDALVDWLVANFTKEQCSAYLRIAMQYADPNFHARPGDLVTVALINRCVPQDLVKKLDAANPGAAADEWFPLWWIGNSGREIWYALKQVALGLSAGQSNN